MVLSFGCQRSPVAIVSELRGLCETHLLKSTNNNRKRSCVDSKTLFWLERARTQVIKSRYFAIFRNSFMFLEPHFHNNINLTYRILWTIISVRLFSSFRIASILFSSNSCIACEILHTRINTSSTWTIWHLHLICDAWLDEWSAWLIYIRCFTKLYEFTRTFLM